MNTEEVTSLYTDLGGAETIHNLVNAFYPKVYQDPELAPLFAGDIEEIKHKQYLFLTQFTGGGPLYSEVYGPPMMKRRHVPFEITRTRAKAWLRCMKEAMEEIGLEGPARDFFYNRLTLVAHHMINSEADLET